MAPEAGSPGQNEVAREAAGAALSNQPPLRFESPTATDSGVAPAAKLPAGWKLTAPMPVLLINTETSLEKPLATARSSHPSPLKSPTATETGLSPAAKLSAAWKVPSPFPRSTETLLELKATATARSSHPSPLKSPTATETGLSPAAKLSAAWKVPSPFPRSTETLLEWG